MGTKIEIEGDEKFVWRLNIGGIESYAITEEETATPVFDKLNDKQRKHLKGIKFMGVGKMALGENNKREPELAPDRVHKENENPPKR